MILITCTIASFITQKSATNIALIETSVLDDSENEQSERILIPMSNPETAEELVNLSLIIKSKWNRSGLYALSVIGNSFTDKHLESQAGRVLEKAVTTAAAADAMAAPRIFAQRCFQFFHLRALDKLGASDDIGYCFIDFFSFKVKLHNLVVKEGAFLQHFLPL